MTNIRAAAAIVVLSGVLAHCASPPPPKPPVPQPVIAPVVRPLAEPGAEFSEWLQLPAQKAAHIGRNTGVAAVWYRCYARSAGELEVTLMSWSHKLSYEVFDDSIVLPSRKGSPVRLARADTSSGPGRSTFSVRGGVYYIRVATETPLTTDDYVLSVTFTRQPPQPRIAETQPVPVPPPQPEPEPEPEPVPAPPSAVPQSFGDAQILSSGTTDTIGPYEHYSKRAYSISVVRPGTLTLNIRTESGRVRATLLDAQQNVVQRSPLSASVTLTAPVQPGTYYVRTESGEGEAAHYTISQEVAETLADGTTDNAVPLTTSTTFNVSVGEGNGYRKRWARYKVEKPSFYALCVALTGAPITVKTYRDTTLLNTTTLRSSGGITGTAPASMLWFEIQSAAGDRSDVRVHLSVNLKSPDAGFLRTGSQPPNPCPH